LIGVLTGGEGLAARLHRQASPSAPGATEWSGSVPLPGARSTEETEFATEPQLAQAMIGAPSRPGSRAPGSPPTRRMGRLSGRRPSWNDTACLRDGDPPERHADHARRRAAGRRADRRRPGLAWKKISAGAGRTARRSTTARGSRCDPTRNAVAGTGCWAAALSQPGGDLLLRLLRVPLLEHRQPGLGRGKPPAPDPRLRSRRIPSSTLRVRIAKFGSL
jgi:hypothetical protein